MRRAALVLLAALAACTGQSTTPTGTTTTAPPSTTTAAPVVRNAGVTHETITVDGRERTYRLDVPASLPAGPVPLLIGLHGGTGWADQFAQTDHVEQLAAAEHFIVVHPDGVKQPGTALGEVWNGGMCCGIASRTNVDDVGFIDALIDELDRRLDIDDDRVFAFGHSNGGIMSYRLACELSDRIVGIGVVAGTLGIDTCTPSEPVSVLHIHGDADQNLPIDGGVGPRSIAGVDFPPPRDGFATLADADGCPAAKPEVDGDLTSAVRAPCDGGAAAVFVTIHGAEHPWPGGTPIIAPTYGATYEDYDATAEIVSFLLAHPRR